MIRQFILIFCLLFVVQAAFSQPPQSVTEISMTSDAGDYIGQGQNYHYARGVGSYVAEAQDQTGDGLADFVRISFTNTVSNWTFVFSTRRTGQPLREGVYENASRWVPFTGTRPGLDVYGNGVGCNQLAGSFTVHQVEYNYDGSSIQLVRLAATFEQHCEGLGAAFYGTIYYNYSPTGSTRSISGQVVNNFGVPVPNASVSLFGSRTKSATANSVGQYNFDQLLDGGTYRVVATAPGHASVNRLFKRLTADQIGDLTLIPNYAIEGRILNEHGQPMVNLPVLLTGSETRSVQTDAMGRYSFTALPANGSYVVVPSTPFFVFDPPSRSWISLPSDQSGDFVGRPSRYSIGGRVTNADGDGLNGIRVELEGGNSEGVSTVTDLNGYYLFAAIPSASNYVVRPSGSVYVFSPSSRNITWLSRDYSDQDFAVISRYSISGFVLDTGGNGVANALVTLSGSATATTATNADGFYSFPSLPAGGTYTITPTRVGLVFAPVSRTTNDLRADGFSNFVGNSTPFLRGSLPFPLTRTQ